MLALPLTLNQAVVLVLYAIFGVAYHAVNKKSYRQHHWALPAHMAAGVLELAMYCVCRSMTPAAFVLCLIQSATNMALTKHLQKGIPSMTRTSYQAGGFLRPLMGAYALVSKSPSAYHDAIVPLHSFVYARLLLFLYSTISPSPDFEDNINSKQVYNLAIPASAFIAIGQTHAGVSAVVAYLLLVNLVGKISLWTRAQLAQPKTAEQSRLQDLAVMFAYIGLRTPDHEHLDPNVNSSPTGNGPTIGRLPGDAAGHWWNAVGRGHCRYQASGELLSGSAADAAGVGAELPRELPRPIDLPGCHQEDR